MYVYSRIGIYNILHTMYVYMIYYSVYPQLVNVDKIKKCGHLLVNVNIYMMILVNSIHNTVLVKTNII